MNFWIFIIVIWICAQMLSHVMDGSSAFQSTPILHDLSDSDELALVRAGSGLPESGNGYLINGEGVNFTQVEPTATLPVLSACGNLGYNPNNHICIRLTRGQTSYEGNQTFARAHSAGSFLVSPPVAAINAISQLQEIQIKIGEGEGLGQKVWNTISAPVSATGSMVSMIRSMMFWDYRFLDGAGWYVKVFLLSMNFVLAMAGLRATSGVISGFLSRR